MSFFCSLLSCFAHGTLATRETPTLHPKSTNRNRFSTTTTKEQQAKSPAAAGQYKKASDSKSSSTSLIRFVTTKIIWSVCLLAHIFGFSFDALNLCWSFQYFRHGQEYLLCRLVDLLVDFCRVASGRHLLSLLAFVAGACTTLTIVHQGLSKTPPLTQICVSIPCTLFQTQHMI